MPAWKTPSRPAPLKIANATGISHPRSILARLLLPKSAHTRTTHSRSRQVVFENYQTGTFYDEMFEGCGDSRRVRTHYQGVETRFKAYSEEDLQSKQAAIDRAFVEHGVTFTVYSDDQGTERIFPLRSLSPHHSDS